MNKSKKKKQVFHAMNEVSGIEWQTMSPDEIVKI
jgi:hypothetical protein